MAEGPLPRIQAFATILTPVLVGIGGLLLNHQAGQTTERLEQIAQTVSAVEAMQPYIDLLADGKPQKAKMAAYALYKLNPRDKQGAVYIILAADRPESNDVLAALAEHDDEIREILLREATGEPPNGKAEKAPPAPPETQATEARIDVAQRPAIARTAVDIVRKYTRSGWMYVGTFDGKRWASGPQFSVRALPRVGGTYTVVDDTYLREGFPEAPAYRLARAAGVVKQGDQVRVVEVKDGVGNQRVWARVQVDYTAK